MNIEQIRGIYNRRPIRPFVIHTAVGERYTVRQPDHMAFAGEDDDGIILLADRGTMTMLDISSITEITQDSMGQEDDAGAWVEWF